MTDKATLRRLARLLSPATYQEGHRVVSRLTGLLGDGDRGCVYLPMPGELDVAAIAEHRSDMQWFTTRTVGRSTLTVHHIDAERETHPFGYEQPVSHSAEIDPVTIDVWIVPGVAFDTAGHRLGHGMGYYDRLLTHAHPSSLLVGVTTERRVFPDIPHEEFDVAMDLVVTEDRVIRP